MSADALYQRGFQHRCNGEYAPAQELFQQALRLDPNHKPSLLQSALILGFTGDFDGSLAALAMLHQRFPADDEILYELAMTQMMLGEDEQACQNFRTILARNPDHEKAQQQIAYC
jgi:tetratricopeptide (TPR) repeat protein